MFIHALVYGYEWTVEIKKLSITCTNGSVPFSTTPTTAQLLIPICGDRNYLEVVCGVDVFYTWLTAPGTAHFTSKKPCSREASDSSFVLIRA